MATGPQKHKLSKSAGEVAILPECVHGQKNVPNDRAQLQRRRLAPNPATSGQRIVTYTRSKRAISGRGPVDGHYSLTTTI
mmetsp:Transcript_10760/g.15533  ORF Transcript_10760/g.15533 Transcript_10760/m.15533 type:complete len:80 (+) Transcript_10760:1152-1391(+)